MHEHIGSEVSPGNVRKEIFEDCIHKMFDIEF